MSKPIPLDLTRFAQSISGGREFLRMWARPDGAFACFINPVPVGADPASFGAALAECVGHAASTYARAVGIGEDEARARIWQGLDAERANPAEPPAPLPPARPGGPVIEFVPKQDSR